MLVDFTNTAVAERRPALLEPNELAEQGPAEAVRLPLDLIDPSPDNPRHSLDDIESLAASIKAYDLLQPILVRRMSDRYQVLAGHRRRAAYLLLAEQEPFEVRWKTIPAVIRTADDAAARLLLISAQVQHRNWTTREEAAILEELAVDHTLREIGEMVHRGANWVSSRLKVYADDVLSVMVQTRRLNASVAQELLQAPEGDIRREYAERAATEGWSPLQARAAVRRLKKSKQLAQLNRLVTAVLDILAGVEASTIPIADFRQMMVLRGRLDVLGQQARGEKVGPRFPSIERAERVAGVRPGQPDRKKRRTRLRID